MYAQHQALFHELNKREWEPREQMLIDLQNKISQWTGQGEQVVLMMDCNEDVRSNQMKKFLDEVRMKECILEKYGEDAPATYIDGRTPIDGIFITWSINIKRGGYTAFDDGIQGQRTDHRCLWVDLNLTDIFGSRNPPLMRFAGRRVKSKHPQVVHKFNTSYKNFVVRHNLAQKIYRLEAEVTFPITPEQQQQAETIARLRNEGIKHADKKCRRLFRGETAFTPQLRQLVATLRLWKFIVRKKNGKKISS